jgi:hypothetical protein
VEGSSRFLKNGGLRMRSTCTGHSTVTSDGSCEHGNGTLDSIKEGKYIDYLSDCQLLKKIMLYEYS